MKSYHTIILLCLLSGCATRKEVRSIPSVEAPGTMVAAAEMQEIRTPETVKAYPVGRYTDPNFPNEMHERHTLYRREQSADWNYHPSQPLPLGPVTALPDSSASYYAKTNAEQINAQQKAHAEALLEQNRAMKERINALQKNESTIQSLHSEVERLRKELDSRKESAQPRRTILRKIFRSGVRGQTARTTRFPIREKSCSFRDRKPTAPHSRFSNAAEQRVDKSARRTGTTQTPEPSFSIDRPPRAHNPKRTMNQLKLSLRAADDPRTTKEENGVPTFASVFSLHNATRNGREETVPITVKASHELAPMLVNELKKGVAFVAEGQLAYYKNPETNRESYSLRAASLTEITPPKSIAAKAS